MQGSQSGQSKQRANNVCQRIPRDRAGPSSRQAAGTFAFILSEDSARQSHLFFTLGQFTRPSTDTGEYVPEDKLVKKFLDARRKEYLESIKT